MSGPPQPAALVLCVEDLVLDVVCRLEGPPAAATDTPAQIGLDAGGQAANAAAWAVAAGARAALLARRSAGPAGRLAEERIVARGVELRGPSGPEEGGVIVVLVDRDGGRDMLTDRGAATLLDAAAADAAWTPDVAAVHVSGYALADGPLRGAARRVAALAARADVPLSLDLSSVALIDAVGPSAFARLAAELAPALVLATSAEIERLGGAGRVRRLGGLLVEKRGARGVRLHDGEEVHDLPAVPARVVDTTGAGDALAGALLAHLVRGDGLRVALEHALPFAARCIEAAGALPAAAGR